MAALLDNLERVDVAHDLNELLAACPGMTILGTSLTALSLRAGEALWRPAERGRAAQSAGGGGRGPFGRARKDALTLTRVGHGCRSYSDANR